MVPTVAGALLVDGADTVLGAPRDAVPAWMVETVVERLIPGEDREAEDAALEDVITFEDCLVDDGPDGATEPGPDWVGDLEDWPADVVPDRLVALADDRLLDAADGLVVGDPDRLPDAVFDGLNEVPLPAVEVTAPELLVTHGTWLDMLGKPTVDAVEARVLGAGADWLGARRVWVGKAEIV